MNRFRAIRKVTAGVALGLVLSVVPVPVALVLCTFLAVGLIIRSYVVSPGCDAVAFAAACGVVAVCLFLPTKHLDAKVGPIAYNDLTLAELCDRLHEDYGIICRVFDAPARNHRLSFATDRPLSRRQVLEKLSRDTNRPLCIGYCGTNATILFGAHPSFTYLEGEKGTGAIIAP